MTACPTSTSSMPGTPVLTRLVLVRRDRLGRVIGCNWWREYNVAIVRDANDAVDAIKGTNHQMEPDEFKAAYPYVTLKQTLIHNAGMSRP